MQKQNITVNCYKYIHTLIVSEPNIVCEGREGESEECWKRKGQKKREEQACEASCDKTEGNEEKQSKGLNSTFYSTALPQTRSPARPYQWQHRALQFAA